MSAGGWIGTCFLIFVGVFVCVSYINFQREKKKGEPGRLEEREREAIRVYLGSLRYYGAAGVNVPCGCKIRVNQKGAMTLYLCSVHGDLPATVPRETMAFRLLQSMRSGNGGSVSDEYVKSLVYAHTPPREIDCGCVAGAQRNGERIVRFCRAHGTSCEFLAQAKMAFSLLRSVNPERR